jgi:hypothetical protein
VQTRIFHFIAWACLSSVSFLACSSGDDSAPTGAGGSTGTGGGGIGGSGTATGGSSGGGTGGSSGGGLPSTCATFNYAGYTAGTTARTLKADVWPIFQSAGCATSGCHANGGIQHPYLGVLGNTNPSNTDLTNIMNELGKNSTEATGAKLLVAGDPANSWLMLKLDQNPDPGCNAICSMSNQTPSPPLPKCGSRMPQTSLTGLPAAQLTTVRDWIKQGAATM